MKESKWLQVCVCVTERESETNGRTTAIIDTRLGTHIHIYTTL